MESTVFTAANVPTAEMPVLRSHMRQTGVDILFGALENTDRHFVIMPDKTPPVVGISHQPKDPTDRDSVSFTATATDKNLETVQIWVDKQLMKSCPSSPCIFSGGPFAVGTHAYYAIAWDTYKNKATTTVQYFKVRGIVPPAGKDSTPSEIRDMIPPVITVSCSFDETNDVSKVTFTATANDVSGISSIAIYVDEICISRTYITESRTRAELRCEAGPYTEGLHPYYAEAEDNHGNLGSTRRKMLSVVHKILFPEDRESSIAGRIFPPPPWVDMPYKGYPYWWKGQVHCHSELSYGLAQIIGVGEAQYPPELLQLYKDKGYKFICITDHNTVTDLNQPVIDIGPVHIGDWDYPVPGIIEIKSAEDGAWCRHHILVLGTEANDTWAKGGGPATCYCSNVMERLDYYDRQSGDPLVVLAHPSSDHNQVCWDLNPFVRGCTHVALGGCGGGWSWDDLTIRGTYDGIEVYNATEPDGWGQNETWWGNLAGQSYRKRVLGFGGDDCHNAIDNPNFNKCWIVVNSQLDPAALGDYDSQEEITIAQDIKENMRAGNFYIVVRGVLGDTNQYGNDMTPPYIMPNIDFEIVPKIVPSGNDAYTISVTTDRESNISFFDQDRRLDYVEMAKKEDGIYTASQVIERNQRGVRFAVDQRGDDGNSYRICSQWFLNTPLPQEPGSTTPAPPMPRREQPPRGEDIQDWEPYDPLD
jgi:hypothetical protein